jgi:hypothetical protein
MSFFVKMMARADVKRLEHLVRINPALQQKSYERRTIDGIQGLVPIAAEGLREWGAQMSHVYVDTFGLYRDKFMRDSNTIATGDCRTDALTHNEIPIRYVVIFGEREQIFDDLGRAGFRSPVEQEGKIQKMSGASIFIYVILAFEGFGGVSQLLGDILYSLEILSCARVEEDCGGSTDSIVHTGTHPGKLSYARDLNRVN